MINRNRIVVDYSLSVLERTQAAKLINDHKKAYIKPYGSVSLIQKAALCVFAISALFNFLLLIQFSLKTAPDGAFIARMKTLSIILLVLFGVALGLFQLYDVLLKKIMAKHQRAEQEDLDTLQKVKLNRFFIENITPTASGKVYWKNIKESYRKKGFIFIHMMNDNCVVIPERVFPSSEEAVKVFDFIKLQLAQNHSAAS
ncbi:YcxB family protein [Leclercia adecarboxylata]|uniref:YcxB family protein n=1 Tax=Leclercia adecarboxylata TaxID=83655 RepID=UPI002DC02623|nr:YcxB family protein [Leclercia adecarboxylata]MEB6379004.1 YcxB family protein [Leclercia adecarboxylata]